jgi:hypothetical protein
VGCSPQPGRDGRPSSGRGLDLLLERRVRDLPLVDAVSFPLTRQRRLDEAFAVDGRFRDEGSTLLSS